MAMQIGAIYSNRSYIKSSRYTKHTFININIHFLVFMKVLGSSARFSSDL